jgi:hypothetical protein
MQSMKAYAYARFRIHGVRLHVNWQLHGARMHRIGCAAQGQNSDDESKVDMDALAKRLSEEASRMWHSDSHDDVEDVGARVGRNEQRTGDEYTKSVVCYRRSVVHPHNDLINLSRYAGEKAALIPLTHCPHKDCHAEGVRGGRNKANWASEFRAKRLRNIQ